MGPEPTRYVFSPDGSIHEPSDHVKPRAITFGQGFEVCSGLNDLSISVDGACSGAHGIGQGKMLYLRKDLGGAVDVMAQIQRALDPDSILNPGKVVTV